MHTIIGIDCATDPKRTGLARAAWDGHRARVDRIALGGPDSLSEQLAAWIPAHGPALLALDAPLGWPAALGAELSRHQAGGPLTSSADLLFRRETDRMIRQIFGRTPLDVGADRIARTARAALHLLEQLRRHTGRSVSLAWDPADCPGITAIEVYPAATLAARGLPSSRYKRGDQRSAREAILAGLGRQLELPEDLRLPRENADALDALVCVQAGADFLAGLARAPQDLALAQKEGWIWARPADAAGAEDARE